MQSTQKQTPHCCILRKSHYKYHFITELNHQTLHQIRRAQLRGLQVSNSKFCSRVRGALKEVAVAAIGAQKQGLKLQSGGFLG
jgi:hypothetical protein